MNIDYNIIGTLVAVIGLFVAVVAIILEGKRARFSQGVDILISKIDQFNNDEFKKIRRKLAKILHNKLSEEILLECETEELYKLAAELLDHFQGVGILIRRRILDDELTHSDYSFVLLRYWSILSIVIIDQRKYLPMLWEDAEWLYNRLVKLEKKYLKKRSLPDFSKEDLLDFCDRELSLP